MLFYFFIYTILCASFVISTPNSSKSCKLDNVILFFSESHKVSNDTSGITCLNMQEVARVKHSVIPAKFHRGYAVPRNAPDCKELLQTSIDSLMHFCQNALGMKTALVHISSKEIINDINEGIQNEPCRDESIKPLEEIRRYPEQGKNPEKFAKLEEELRHRRLHQKLINRIQHRAPHNNVDDTIPSYSKMRLVSPLSDIITSPEHTEVFKIRVKRDDNAEDEKPGEIIDIPLERDKNKKSWDVLDIMSHIRYSFFGKLFQNDKNEANNIISNEESKLLDEIGEVKRDPGLFDTVRSTLLSLQEGEGPEGFIMIVFGGHLNEVEDKHSPLVQSIKHVIETTDPEKTLIVLTGSCPETQNGGENVVIISEGGPSDMHPIPVFVKGPKSEKLAPCKQLYDIPLTIKLILEETSPNFGELPRSPRPKRSVFYGKHTRSGGKYSHKLNWFASFIVCLPIFIIICNFYI